MVITKEKLSGSTNAKGIKVTQTASAGDTIHTAINNTTDWDEVWIYAYNGHTANVTLTLQLGGTTSPDDDVKIDLPFKAGRFLVLDGALMQNSNVLKAYASTANVVVITGFVNRITA